MTLVCEDDKSNLLRLTVAHVDDEKRVDNSLVQIWKLKFGHKTNFFQILSTGFGQDFEVEVQARF